MTELSLQQAFLDAVKADDRETARTQLAKGADVNAVKGEYANTPLMKAVSYGYESMTAFLIRSGAELDAADEHGETALHWAIMTKKPRLAEMLIRKGARVHKPDEEHDTPFDLAVRNKQQRIIDLIRDMPGPQAELDAIREKAEAEIAARIAEEAARVQSLADMRSRLKAGAPRLKPVGGRLS